MTGVVPTARIKTTVVACMFFDAWVLPHGIPSYLLTGNGTPFISKFFSTLCIHLGTKHMTTTAFHPQTSGQVERYNETIITCLRHYVATH